MVECFSYKEKADSSSLSLLNGKNGSMVGRQFVILKVKVQFLFFTLIKSSMAQKVNSLNLRLNKRLN